MWRHIKRKDALTEDYSKQIVKLEASLSEKDEEVHKNWPQTTLPLREEGDARVIPRNYSVCKIHSGVLHYYYHDYCCVHSNSGLYWIRICPFYGPINSV